MLAIQHDQRPETGSKIDVATGGEQKNRKKACGQRHTPFSSFSILISLSVGHSSLDPVSSHIKSPCSQKQPLELTSQAELGNGICFILDSTNLEAPATQCQSHHLPHLPHHTLGYSAIYTTV